MVDSISKEASPGATPEKHQMEQFKKGVFLFKKALEDFQGSDIIEVEKRQKSKHLMQEAICVMSETAAEACKEKKSLQQAEKKLEVDFQDFHKSVEIKNSAKIKKSCQSLQKDIERIAKELP